MHGYR
jgi:hypothetical protein